MSHLNMLTLLSLLSFLGLSFGYPDRLACTTTLTVGGTKVMGVRPTSSTDRSLSFTRVSDSSTLGDGDFYVAGESLEAYISDTTDYYLLEVNTDGFSSYTCSESSNGYTRVNSNTEGASGANGLTITAPSTGDLEFKAVWSDGYGNTINLRMITLKEPTPSPTFQPTSLPSKPRPTNSPTLTPSPTLEPSSSPTSATPAPSPMPSFQPSFMPTMKPTPQPSSSPETDEDEDDNDSVASNSVDQASISVATATFIGFGLFFLFIGPILAFAKYRAATNALQAGLATPDGDDFDGVYEGGTGL